MLGIRALATFLRFWHDLMRVAYHRRRRIIPKITRPRPLAIARETLFGPYRASLCGLDTPLHSFHHKRHPNEMGEREITQFLTHLAVQKNVAASTQNQALAALLFLYQQVLERKLDFMDNELCDASARGRIRHSNRAGAARPQECRHDHALHARFDSARPAYPQPARSNRIQP